MTNIACAWSEFKSQPQGGGKRGAKLLSYYDGLERTLLLSLMPWLDKVCLILAASGLIERLVDREVQTGGLL